MTAAEPAPLTDRQSAIVARLAKRRASLTAARGVLSGEDFYQSGYLAAWESASKRGGPLTDVEVYVAARCGMLRLERSTLADDARRREVGADPLRPRESRGSVALETIDALDALGLLDDDERLVLVGRYWRGLKDAEIARETGLTLNQVHARGARGVRKARAFLAGDYGDQYGRKHPRKYGWRIYGSYHAAKAERAETNP